MTSISSHLDPCIPTLSALLPFHNHSFTHYMCVKPLLCAKCCLGTWGTAVPKWSSYSTIPCCPQAPGHPIVHTRHSGPCLTISCTSSWALTALSFFQCGDHTACSHSSGPLNMLFLLLETLFQLHVIWPSLLWCLCLGRVPLIAPPPQAGHFFFSGPPIVRLSPHQSPGPLFSVSEDTAVPLSLRAPRGQGWILFIFKDNPES